jgi:hypothetical protein
LPHIPLLHLFPLFHCSSFSSLSFHLYSSSLSHHLLGLCRPGVSRPTEYTSLFRSWSPALPHINLNTVKNCASRVAVLLNSFDSQLAEVTASFLSRRIEIQ